MHHFIALTTSLIGILGNTVAANANAQSPISVLSQPALSEQQTSRWSGSTSLYILSSKGKSTQNNTIDSDNTTINSLDSGPTDYKLSTILPTASLNYNVSESRYFSLSIFNTSLTTHSFLENQSLIAISAHQTFADGSSIWASLSPNIPGLYKAWQDPFLTGRPLQKTNASLNMFAVGAEYILGTPFSISSSLGKHEIGKDQAGVSLGSQLNTNQLTQLQRDTTFADARLSATMALYENLYLEVGINYFHANAEGKANSFNAKGFDVGLVYIAESTEAYISAKIDSIDFTASNPVFNQKREEDNYTISAGFSYKNPFALKNLSAEFFTSTSNRNSNITFFNANDTNLALGVNYEF